MRRTALLSLTFLALLPGRAAAQDEDEIGLTFYDHVGLGAVVAVNPAAGWPGAVPWGPLTVGGGYVSPFPRPFPFYPRMLATLIGAAPAAGGLAAVPWGPVAVGLGGVSWVPVTPYLTLELELDSPERGHHVSVSAMGLFRPGQIDQVRSAVEEAVGPITEAETAKSSVTWSLHGRCPDVLKRRGWGHHGRIDVGPLIEVARGMGRAHVDVTIFHPTRKLRFNPPQPGDGADDEAEEGPDEGPVRSGATYSYQFLAGGDLLGGPSVIEFGYGPPDDAPARLAALGLILALPVLLTLWRRRLALRQADVDPVRAWHGYHGFQRWNMLALMLVWMVALPLADGVRILQEAGVLPADVPRPVVRADGLPRVGSSLLVVGRLTCFLVPPLVVTVLCHALGQPVHSRLRGEGWTSADMFRQGAVVVIFQLGPVFLGIAGLLVLVFDFAARPGVALLLAAFVTHQLGAIFVARTQDLIPVALTTGALRDRCFELAAKVNVKLEQVYLLPAGRGKLINAFAMIGNNVLLAELLVRGLTRREVDAVVAHEVGHLGAKHLKRSRGCLLNVLGVALVSGVLVGAQMSGYAKQIDVDRWWIALIGVPIIAITALSTFRSRRWERVADAEAVRLTGDPEALVTGLAKIARLNLMPLEWGRFESKMVTHPSMRVRFGWIAEAGGLPPGRVEELLALVEHGEPLPARNPLPEAPPAPDDHYPIPPVVDGDAGREFSTRYKATLMARVGWGLTAAIVLPPVLVAYLVWSQVVPPEHAPWAYLAGVPLTIATFLWAYNRLGVHADRPLRRAVGARLAAEGLDPAEYDGEFVGFGPDDRPRIYEGFFDWDVGFLTLAGDRLTYVGEQARFGLRRDQVTAVEWAPGGIGWIRTGRAYVRWRDGEASGVFHLRGAGMRRVSEIAAASGSLAERLTAWWQGSRTGGSLPAALAGLGPPQIGEVTSVSPRQVAGPAFRGQAPVLMLLAAAVAVVAGLPFLPDLGLPFFRQEGTHGWYPVGVALFMAAFMLWPYWRSRDPVPEGPTV